MHQIVQDAGEFKRIWRILYPTCTYESYVHAPKSPEINFSKEVVVVAALGQENNGGYAIRVIEVVQGDGQVEVLVKMTAPATGCYVTASVIWTIDIIRMEIPSKPVSIPANNETTDCN